MIKHANTIQYVKINQQPVTKVFSSFVNIRGLELESSIGNAWVCLKDLSLPFLQILRTKAVPVNMLTGLIERSGGYLTEVNLSHTYHEEVDNKRIIQAIYQKCPNLKYLKLLFRKSSLLELENLLINCQNLNGLFIVVGEMIDWDDLFKVLAKSSPTSLFKFKFWFYFPIKLESLKLFFDSWKDRHPMLLQTIPFNNVNMEIYFDLVVKYKTKGVVEKYDNDHMRNFEDFEWVKKKIN